MPTINRGKKKVRESKNYEKKGNSLIVAKLYNTSNWRKLRLSWLQTHPLCQDCLDEFTENEDGSFGIKITPATEVHHVKPILTASSELEMKELAFDPNNLRSLCDYHHHLIHKRLHQNKP